MPGVVSQGCPSILITGGLGFVGSTLAWLLNGRYSIQVIDWDRGPLAEEMTARMRAEGITVHHFDVADAVAWRAVSPTDFVFHAAAQVAAEVSAQDPARDHLTNVHGTFLVAEFARTNGARVIFCNSIRIYDPLAVDARMARHGSIAENSPTVAMANTPQPAFALSKLAAEETLMRYARQHGVRVISMRMSGIAGSGQHSNAMHGWLSYLIRCAAERCTYTIFGDGTQSRDVLHVDDLMALIQMLLGKFDRFCEGRSAIYNVGGGPALRISILEAIELLKREFGVSVTTAFGPARKGEPRHYATDFTRLDKLGWRPQTQDPSRLIARLLPCEVETKLQRTTPP